MQACLVEPPSSTSGRMQLVTHRSKGFERSNLKERLNDFVILNRLLQLHFFFPLTQRAEELCLVVLGSGWPHMSVVMYRVRLIGPHPLKMEWFPL